MNKEILEDLKKGVILTGRLSEVHVKTLQTSPFIFFDELENVTISYDVKTDQSAGMPGLSSKVGFVLKFKDGYAPDLLPQRVEALKKTVRSILWSETAVTIEDEKGKSLDVEPSKS